MRCLYILVILAVLLIVLRYIPTNEGFETAKTVTICKAEWCGHCKNAAPEFKKLADASPITLSNGSKATVKILDADADAEDVKKLPVRGYPSILIENGAKPIEYPGERTAQAVIEYLNSM